MDFGFLPFFKQSILDEAKRLSLGRRTSNFGLTCGVREVRRTKRDAYQLEVEKCVCAAARSAALWPWTTRVVSVTGKSGERSSTMLPSSQASSLLLAPQFFCGPTSAGDGSAWLRLYGQVNKRIRWMPWQLKATKDVEACDKPRGVGKQTLIRGCPNGETQPFRWLSRTEYIGARGEPGELKYLSTRRKRNQPRFPQ